MSSGSRRRAMANWSDLPKDLLLSIGQRLDTYFDILHIRSVCSPWRASVPLNLLPLPTLRLTFPGINGEDKKVLKRSSICLFKSTVDPSQIWLGSLFVEHNIEEIRIWNPIEGGMILPVVLDISKLDVQVLGLKYSTENHYRNYYSVQTYCLNVDPNHDDRFYVLEVNDALSNPMCLFKTGDKKLITIGREGLNNRTHFIPFKGKFYVVDSVGTTMSIEPCSGAKSLVCKAFTFGGGYNYLVESSSRGKLLLIEEIIENEALFESPPKVGFKVYEMDEEKKIWVHLESLGDMILFLGDQVWANCKFSASAIPGVEGNCIVFSEHLEAYVFHLSNGKTVPLDDRPDLLKLLRPKLSF